MSPGAHMNVFLIIWITDMMRPALILATSVFALSLSAGFGYPGEINPAIEGRALAEKLCARCHAVGRDDASPLRLAPPFRTLASKWPLESLEEALAEGIVTGHPEMPVFQFEPAQIVAFIEYLHEISKNSRQPAQ